MKLSGIEIKNFRSIGEKGIKINPFTKCNILIGQNNVGKSNVIRALKLISDHFKFKNSNALTELDLFNREKEKPFLFNLFFKLDSTDSEYLKMIEGDTIWFKFKWEINGNPQIIDHTFARVTDQSKSGLALNRFSGGRQWARQVSASDILRVFLEDDLKKRIWDVFNNYIPIVNVIPEFRQIRKGEKLTYDGENLVETLAHYQLPDIGKDEDQQKFIRIQKYLNLFLNLPDAKLEVSRKDSTLIINNGIRLPLSSFGTSVHELLILLTSITSMDNAICCIEEPEIHFHPILQKEFLRFLVDNTENTFFISTHSPAFINAIKDSTKVQLIHLKKVGQITEQSSIFKKGETWDLLKDIGVNPSDLLQTNCIIWVEGPSDIYYLKKWISLLDPNLVDNRDYSFFCYSIHRTLFIDGEEIDNRRTNVLSINRNSIVVVDSDKKNTEDKIKTEKSHIIESCKKNNIHCWLTDRREIENYLSKSTVKRALKSLRDVEIEIEIGMFDDIGERMDQELKSKKLLPLNYCNNKTSLANKFSSFIELEDIDKELMENISALIQKIKSFN